MSHSLFTFFQECIRQLYLFDVRKSKCFGWSNNSCRLTMTSRSVTKTLNGLICGLQNCSKLNFCKEQTFHPDKKKQRNPEFRLTFMQFSDHSFPKVEMMQNVPLPRLYPVLSSQFLRRFASAELSHVHFLGSDLLCDSSFLSIDGLCRELSNLCPCLSFP